jgi:hypothetical protein
MSNGTTGVRSLPLGSVVFDTSPYLSSLQVDEDGSCAQRTLGTISVTGAQGRAPGQIHWQARTSKNKTPSQNQYRSHGQLRLSTLKNLQFGTSSLMTNFGSPPRTPKAMTLLPRGLSSNLYTQAPGCGCSPVRFQ